MLIAALKAWKDLSIYTISYLIICLGDVLDNYVQNFEKIFFLQKNVFLP